MLSPPQYEIIFMIALFTLIFIPSEYVYIYDLKKYLIQYVHGLGIFNSILF